MAEITNQTLNQLLAVAEEKTRIHALTNEQLAREALSTGLCDYMLVDEMMTRLDPHWADEEPAATLPNASRRE